MDLTSRALTDVGKRRENNEDRCFVDEDLGLFIVCDGMGDTQRVRRRRKKPSSTLPPRSVNTWVKQANRQPPKSIRAAMPKSPNWRSVQQVSACIRSHARNQQIGRAHV